MRYEVRLGAFYLEDLDAIDTVAGKLMGDVDVLRDKIVPMFARTAFHGDTVLGAGGVIPIFAGSGVAWAAVDRGVNRRLIRAVIETTREGLRRISEAGPFHRIQADIHHDFQAGRKFAEALGFIHEGLMATYTPEGVDYDRYALVDRALVPLNGGMSDG